MPLTIKIPGKELFNNKTQEFIYLPDYEITLEHSLISISKWEAKWHVSYIDTKEKTPEQTFDYIRCMSIKGEIPDDVLFNLSVKNIESIMDYIDNPMTATVIKSKDSTVRNQLITSELIYAWMVGYQIPFECQKWHLNRLLKLIQTVKELNKPSKKMSQSEIAARNKAINAKNRARFKSKG